MSPIAQQIITDITVFGKHCECNAQKCTHLKCLPPLASHLLLLSHCVLTQHEGQKQKSRPHGRLQESNKGRLALQNIHLSTMLIMLFICQMPIILNYKSQLVLRTEKFS